jgi:hypothetical protein
MEGSPRREGRLAQTTQPTGMSMKKRATKINLVHGVHKIKLTTTIWTG